MSNEQRKVWEQVISPIINSKLQSKGFTGSVEDGYFAGPFTISDISPWNIGYNKNDQLRFLDFDAYE